MDEHGCVDDVSLVISVAMGTRFRKLTKAWEVADRLLTIVRSLVKPWLTGLSKGFWAICVRETDCDCDDEEQERERGGTRWALHTQITRR